MGRYFVSRLNQCEVGAEGRRAPQEQNGFPSIRHWGISTVRRMCIWGAIVALAAGLTNGPQAADTLQTRQYTGTVLDLNGQPVPGAAVDFFVAPPGNNAELWEATERQHATTDSKGAFKFSGSGGMAIAVVRKSGFACVWTSFGSRPIDSDAQVVLTPPTSLSGQVVDENERPVADAEVWMDSAMAVGPTEYGGTCRGSSLVGKPARESFSVRTGPDGSFRMADLPEDAWIELVAQKQGKACREPRRFNSGQTNIILRVGPAGSVEGQVLAEGTGQPVAGVQLRVYSVREGYSDTALSDATGAFRISGIRPGEAVLGMTGCEAFPDWLILPVHLTVAAGQTNRAVEVRATKGGNAEILVLSNNRKPLPGAGVAGLRQSLDIPYPSWFPTGVTGTDGIARFHLTPGQWLMSVGEAAEDWDTGRVAIRIAGGQTNRAEIELRPGVSFTGTVRDPSGAPAAGVWVHYTGMGPSGEAKTDSQGRYAIHVRRTSETTDFPPLVWVRDVEHGLAAAYWLTNPTNTLDIQLLQGLTLIANVQDPDGKPVPSAISDLTVWRGNMGIAPLGCFRADSRGVVEMKAMPPGIQYGLGVDAAGRSRGYVHLHPSNTGSKCVDFPVIVLQPEDKTRAREGTPPPNGGGI
jgi:hypothetical protein